MTHLSMSENTVLPFTVVLWSSFLKLPCKFLGISNTFILGITVIVMDFAGSEKSLLKTHVTV